MTAEKPLLVTVFSDASLKDTVAGFGWWYKSEVTSGSGSAQKLSFGTDIGVAELYGILLAMQEVVKGHPNRKLVIVLQCDSLTALGAVASIGAKSAKTSPIQVQPRKRLKPEELAYLAALKELLGDTPVWLKHVKGHNGHKCRRSSVNTLTDRLSRQGRTKK